MVTLDDPYFAGHILEKSSRPHDDGGPPPVVAWICVFAANLVVPVIFGCGVTDAAGKAGMVIGVIAVFVLGCRICFISRTAVLAVVYGGWIVAASQLVPILQIIAGIFGVGAANVVGQLISTLQFLSGVNGVDAARALNGERNHGSAEVNTTLGGLIATLVTGGILIGATVPPGLLIQLLMKWWNHGECGDDEADPKGVRFDHVGDI